MTEGDNRPCATCGRGHSFLPRFLDNANSIARNAGRVGGCGKSGWTPDLLGDPAAVAALMNNTDAKTAMRWRWCRVFYSTRTRAQRRRLLAWTATIIFLLCLAYCNQQGLAVLSAVSFNSRDYDLNSNNNLQAAPFSMHHHHGAGEEIVGRQPRALMKQGEAAAVAGAPAALPRVPALGENPDPPDNKNNDDEKKKNNNGEEGEVQEQEEEDDDKSDLRSDLAPATLHFLWCGGKRHFEFRHFMAMKRAERLVRPDKIFFHYEELPVVDQEGYFLWFNRTLADVHNILLRPLMTNASSSPPCSLEGAAGRYLLVLQILERFGGIYVPEDALLVDFPVHLRSSDLVTGVRAVSPGEFRDGLIAGRKGAFKKPTTAEELLVTLSREDQGDIQPCGTVDHYNSEEDGDCICVKVGSSLYPRDILETGTLFGTLARLSAYGVPELRPEYSLRKNPIPRIAHYVCVNCEVRFIAFLSMRSAVNVAGLNKVYLHGVKEPGGKWWDKLKEDSRFVYVHREYPETPYELSHDQAVGMMRIAILLKYGGVYCDEKVLWTQRIPDNHFGYSAVASPDWHAYGSWPDSVNHAALMAKKNAPYLLRLRSVLHKYQRQNAFWFNDHFMAYKILETHPESLHLDRHLQVKCLNHNCHPTWQENYRSGLLQNRPGSGFRWQNETLSVHWTDTFPELDLDTVKYTSGMVVEVCRNILRQSGMVIQDLR